MNAMAAASGVPTPSTAVPSVTMIPSELGSGSPPVAPDWVNWLTWALTFAPFVVAILMAFVYLVGKLRRRVIRRHSPYLLVGSALLLAGSTVSIGESTSFLEIVFRREHGVVGGNLLLVTQIVAATAAGLAGAFCLIRATRAAFALVGAALAALVLAVVAFDAPTISYLGLASVETQRVLWAPNFAIGLIAPLLLICAELESRSAKAVKTSWTKPRAVLFLEARGERLAATIVRSTAPAVRMFTGVFRKIRWRR